MLPSTTTTLHLSTKTRILTPILNTHHHQRRQPSRTVSTSPYGRTHVWRRRPPSLPAPVVPQFPQRVIRSDGSTFTHWTTSPRSLIRLTRDVTNHPVWNSVAAAAASAAGGALGGEEGDEEGGGGKGAMGRFRRRFGGGGGGQMDWMEGSELASEKSDKKE